MILNNNSDLFFALSNDLTISARYFVKVQLNGPSHEPVLQDKTSPQYLSLQEGIENGINTVFRDCPGKQIIAELDFRFVSTLT